VPIELIGFAGTHRLVVTLEDGIRTGGVGEAIGSMLHEADVDVPLLTFAVPSGFHPHGSRAEVLATLGLTVPDIVREVTESLPAHEPSA
jgi:1-deoxy-D-xylulose-5-phosphate synthase